MTHPTINQVYCNPEVFISLLEGAGLVNAAAKVGGLLYRMNQLAVGQDMLDDYRSQRAIAGQQVKKTRKNKNRQTYDRLDAYKRIGQKKEEIEHFKMFTGRLERQLKSKIEKWPEVDFQSLKLRTRPDVERIKKIKKRRSLRKNKTKPSTG